MRRALLPLALVLLVAAGPAAPAARADADPASDILLTQSAFFPYQPNTVTQGLQTQMQTLLKETAAAGFPIKVAIVATATDLGGVADLFSQPQRYATFLSSEISFNTKSPLLVVMPNGMATANIASSRSLATVTLDHSTSDAMTASAVTAIEKLAAENGHPVKPPPAPSGSSSGSGGGSSTAVVLGAVVVLLLLALGVALMVRSRGDEELDREDDPE